MAYTVEVMRRELVSMLWHVNLGLATLSYRCQQREMRIMHRPWTNVSYAILTLQRLLVTYQLSPPTEDPCLRSLIPEHKDARKQEQRGALAPVDFDFHILY